MGLRVAHQMTRAGPQQGASLHRELAESLQGLLNLLQRQSQVCLGAISLQLLCGLKVKLSCCTCCSSSCMQYIGRLTSDDPFNAGTLTPVLVSITCTVCLGTRTAVHCLGCFFVHRSVDQHLNWSHYQASLPCCLVFCRTATSSSIGTGSIT